MHHEFHLQACLLFLLYYVQYRLNLKKAFKFKFYRNLISTQFIQPSWEYKNNSHGRVHKRCCDIVHIINKKYTHYECFISLFHCFTRSAFLNFSENSRMLLFCISDYLGFMNHNLKALSPSDNPSLYALLKRTCDIDIF